MRAYQPLNRTSKIVRTRKREREREMKIKIGMPFLFIINIAKFHKKKISNQINHGNNGGKNPTSCASTNSDRVSSIATLFSRNCISSIKYTPAIQMAECCKSTSAQKIFHNDSTSNFTVKEELKSCCFGHCQNIKLTSHTFSYSKLHQLLCRKHNYFGF